MNPGGPATLRVEVLASGAALLDAAGDFLGAREAEHSFLLGLSAAIRDRPEHYPDADLAFVRDRSGVCLVAVRTPPDHLVISLADNPAAVDAVAADALAWSRRPSGVRGPVDEARRFVKAWRAAGGSASALEIRTRTYRLDRVIPAATRCAGGPRVAGQGDVAILGAWVAAFEAEALPHAPTSDVPEDVVARWMDDPGRVVWLWEDGGRPVSMAVAGSRTPNGRRIGAVYTPPDHRRRGYAGALVAAVSEAELAAGRRFCFLDTDLSNATSNRIYESIGYRAVLDGESYGFAPG